MEDFYGQPPKKSKWWLWVLFILILAGLGYGRYWYYKNIYQEKSSNSETENLQTKIPEGWTRADKMILANVTSSCTIKLDDGSYRMYYMKDGKIVYANSTDAANFSSAASTDVTEDPGKMVSNPSVLKIKDGNWIMVYEQAPTKTPGSSGKTPPGPNTQRNLYLAKSEDGMMFKKVGLIIDSSKEDNYFASVPDLVLLPNGKIRMYYVSGGEATGSAISSDNGQNWTRETGYRLTGSVVDPDVLYQTKDGKESWVMYYSVLTPDNNALYKTTSTDGINWQPGEIILKPSSVSQTLVDPDVVQISADKYRMFYGEAGGDSTQGGTTINLYYADSNGDIF